VAYDVVIKGGRIVDGTGAVAFDGDLAVQGGRIAGVGQRRRRRGPDDRCIGARGGAGFIDAHTHYDAQLMWDPTANPSTTHGITTVLTGNCGYSLAPVRKDDQDYLIGLFAAAEEIPKGALQLFAPFPWETFPDFLDSLQGRIGVNVVAQVGHSAVRRFVMGQAALERAATPEEVSEMVVIVEAAMAAGAAGLSSSQAPHQRGENGEHIPSFFADAAETRALAEAVRRKGARLLSINPGSKRDGSMTGTEPSWSNWPNSRVRWCRGTISAWALPTATASSNSWKPNFREGSRSTPSRVANERKPASR